MIEKQMKISSKMFASKMEYIILNLSKIASIMVFLVLLSIFVSLVYCSYDAINKFGIKFIIDPSWDVLNNRFGALSSIYGTIISTIIAILLAAPIAIGTAIFLTEIAPTKIKTFFSISIELLAAIPSIVYGMWGFLYFVPLVQKIFGGTGFGLLSGGLVLCVMILPFIASITRDSMEATPSILKESAYALGATKFDVIKNVIFPYAKSSIIGSIILGLGRAFGETMAVAFLLGGTMLFPKNFQEIFSTITNTATSIPVTLALQFGEAMGNRLYESVMFYLALILFVISFIIIALAKFIFLKQKRIAK